MKFYKFIIISFLFIVIVTFPAIAKTKIQINLFKDAYDNFLNKKYNESTKYLIQYINQFPKEKDIYYAYFLLGESNYYNQEYIEAIKIYKNLLLDFQMNDILTRKINFSLACAYLSSNQTEKAIDEFAHIFSNYPFTREGLLSQIKIADCYYDKQDFEKAFEIYNKIYKKIIQDKSINSYGLKIGNRYAAALMKNGNNDKSIEIYKEILEKNTDSAEMYTVKMNLAINNYYILNYEKARKGINDIISDNYVKLETLAEAYYWLGRIDYEQSYYSKALISFNKVITFFPQYENELFYNTKLAIAKTYFKIDKIKDAEEILNYLIKKPNEISVVPAAYYALAEIYEKDGKVIRAINIYLKIIEIMGNLNSFEVKNIWEETYFNALQKYKNLIQKTSTEEDAVVSSLYIIAESYYKNGYYQEAENSYKEITQNYNSNAFSLEAWLKLANIYVSQNRIAETKEIITDINKKYPKIDYIEKIKILLAKNYYKNEKYDSSFQLSKEIIKITSDENVLINAYYIIAKSLLKQNRLEESKIYLNKIINANPYSNWMEKALYELGWLHIKQKKYEYALKVFLELEVNYPHFKTENVLELIADLYYRGSAFKAAIEKYAILVEKNHIAKTKKHATYWLGWSYVGEKDYKNAADVFSLYFNTYLINSKNTELVVLNYAIAECKRAEGNFFESNIFYNRIISDFSDTDYCGLSKDGAKAAYEKKKEVFLIPKNIDIDDYEDTFENEKLIQNIQYKYFSRDFPFIFTEKFISKYRYPEITYMFLNENLSLKIGDELVVTIKGSPYQKAYFNITNFKTDILLEELSPGVYRGSYKVKIEDNVNDAEIFVFFKNHDNFITYLASNKKVNFKNSEAQFIQSFNDMEIKVIEIKDIPQNIFRLATDLKVYVLAGGVIEGLDIIKSSGNNELDELAIKTFKKEKKYQPIKFDSIEKSLRIFNVRVVFVHIKK